MGSYLKADIQNANILQDVTLGIEVVEFLKIKLARGSFLKRNLRGRGSPTTLPFLDQDVIM